ncbi:Twin-arginine translocation protein TatA [Amycolatopsis sp. CA-230715]|uniref:Twin-arginine translocation protein TatA n=1 Tax=Amycolatopsis sp. CA-230715 TaxID=2745196 RepID=UPI001C0279A4|nr:Twin-arginine translocation protein TatA [Amycolatopsis sp. CA-230715]QWF80522.1 hypothetical protein HUW46_03945 [Amycolatopsis sp. CA-230715]
MSHPQQPGNWGHPGHPQGHGYGYPQGPGHPQGYGYPPGGPPKKSKAGLWAAIAIGVVVLLALAITGFVAPGFFLSKDDGAQAGPVAPPPSAPSESTSDTPSAAPSSSSGGESREKAVALAKQFVDKLNANDPKGAGAMKCPNSGTILEGVILLSIEPPTSLTVGSATGGGLKIDVEVSGTTKGKQVSGTVSVQDRPGTPQCIRLIMVR